LTGVTCPWDKEIVLGYWFNSVGANPKGNINREESLIQSLPQSLVHHSRISLLALLTFL